MNSASLSYQLPSFTGVISHGWLRPAFVRDTEEAEDTPRVTGKLEVQVRSGDYFVTLASELDQLSRDVKDYKIREDLEDIVSDLIHLQDNYTITKNNPAK